MVTFFSVPKPFSGHIGVIQRNALRSWLSGTGARAILFGDEVGVAEAAAAAGAVHEPSVTRNHYGTPRLDVVFARVRSMQDSRLVTYINSDVMVLPSFFSSAARLSELFGGRPFLAIGCRTDLQIEREIDFSHPDWPSAVQKEADEKGLLHGWAGVDYFLFPASLKIDLPPFPVGRPGWDNWLIGWALQSHIPVVDITGAVTVIHQNHPPAYRPGGAETADNISLAGGLSGMCTIYNATYLLAGNRLRRPPAARRLASLILTRTPAKYILGLKRRISFILSK